MLPVGNHDVKIPAESGRPDNAFQVPQMQGIKAAPVHARGIAFAVNARGVNDGVLDNSLRPPGIQGLRRTGSISLRNHSGGLTFGNSLLVSHGYSLQR